MSDQTIVAVYDTPAHAELAVQDMLQAGVPEAAIERHAQEGSYTGNSTALTSRPAQTDGFWANLFGGEPDHDTAVYDRSVQGGSTVVSVKVPDAHVARVTQILESHAPIDIDERVQTYGLTRTADRATETPRAIRAAEMPRATEAARTDSNGGTLQLSEESLVVGKRVVNRGTTRIRRFVVETPVEEQVRLHDERVTVDRHPVTDDRPVADADFGDKVIEMTETGEEAVVSKTARVKEEIVLRKETADRTETVRDTVRREDVEIVKVPGEDVTSTATPVTPRTPKV